MMCPCVRRTRQMCLLQQRYRLCCVVTQNFGTKLNTVANTLEETGLTLLDLKTAKMVTGTEDGLTVRKFLIAAAPAKIVDLSKLQLKVRSAPQVTYTQWNQ